MFDITKTKAVLWDLDDTLYSRVGAARLTYPGMFKELLYTDKSDEFIEEAADFMLSLAVNNSMIRVDAFNALLEKYPADKPYVYEKCADYYYDHIVDFATPFPEQISVIKKLNELGVKNAIVTNIPSDRVDAQRNKITALGIADLFDEIVISGAIGIHKPDRGIFDYSAKLLGVANNECVFVGDYADSDVVGGLNSDMDVVWIDTEGTDHRFDNNPRVHRVKSVLEYFKLKG